MVALAVENFMCINLPSGASVSDSWEVTIMILNLDARQQ